jgi:hypothetical protein
MNILIEPSTNGKPAQKVALNNREAWWAAGVPLHLQPLDREEQQGEIERLARLALTLDQNPHFRERWIRAQELLKGVR